MPASGSDPCRFHSGNSRAADGDTGTGGAIELESGAGSTGAGGDIVVNSTESYTNSAVTGDILVGMLKTRGAAGLVTDGMVRDEEGILVIGLPVFSRGVTPNSCVRNGPGTIGMNPARFDVTTGWT